MPIQLNIPYTFVGPDGTTAVLNDPASGNYVGILRDISGLDNPEIRESADVLVEGDGGVHGTFYMGRRPVTMEGVIMGDTPTLRNQRMEKLERATRALRADATMTWTETGRAETRLLLRRSSPMRFGGALPKSFQVGLVSANPLIESSVENALSDLVAPLSIALVNAGNAYTYARISVYGVTTSPVTLTNTTNGEIVKLNSAIGAAPARRVVNTDPLVRTVVDEAGVNKYAELDFLGTSWISLAPGPNTITSDKGTRLDISWRDAWL